MKKRLLFKLLILAAILMSLQASAAMYIVGNTPFGGWEPSVGLQMTDNGDGTYSCSARIAGATWFVFADGLASQGDWATFNSTYRIGPTADSVTDEEVTKDTWTTTQKAPNGTKAYKFTGNGSEYDITFDKTNMRFMISGGAPYGFESDGIYYNITGSNSVSVTKSSGYCSDYTGDVVIPSSVTHDGVTYTVTAIGYHAFFVCEGLTSVSIPTTVTTIEETAFYSCPALTRVEIPESIGWLRDWNFYGCHELKWLVLPSSFYYLGDYCFGACPKLTTVICKATTPPTFGTGAFCDSPIGSTLYVPSGSVSDYQANRNWSSAFTTITGMPGWDFEVDCICYNITGTSPATVEVTYPGSTYSISPYSGHIVIPPTVTYDGVTYTVTTLGSYSFYRCHDLISVELPNTVKTINERVFFQCPALETLTLSEGLTTVGTYSIVGNEQLKSLYIPSTLTTLSYQALTGNGGLEAITVASGNPKYDSRDDCNAIIETATNTLLFGSINTRIPETVTSIGEAAFSRTRLKTIYFPNSVTSIAYNAFVNSGLEYIFIPETVTSVGSFAFQSCSKLREVNFGYGFPSSLGYGVFNSCPRLTSFTVLAKNPPTLSANVIESSILTQATLYVDLNRASYYQNADVWQNFSNIEVKCYDFLLDDVYYLRTGNNTASVSFKDTDWSVDEYTYRGDVTIPDNFQADGVDFTVTAIRNSAFYRCSGMTGITFPESSLQKIEASAFVNCTSLTKVDIPESVTFVGGLAFYGCSSMEYLSIGANCSFLNQGNVFKGCDNLRYVTCYATTPPEIHETCFTQTIYDNAVLYVPKNSVGLYQTADNWKNFYAIDATPFDFMEDGIYYKIIGTRRVAVTFRDYTFNSYSGSVVVPTTVTHNGITYQVEQIANNAFAECRDLTSVTLPNTITFIDYNAFRQSGITSITVPDAVTYIGEGAFSYCFDLTTVTLGSGLTDLGLYVFEGSDAIETIICRATTPPTVEELEQGNAFVPEVYQNAVLHVPYGSHEAYRNAAVWSRFVNIVSEEVIEPILTGDVNGDDRVNISDVTTLINYLLSHNTSGLNMAAADVNGDNNVNISDVTALINSLLNGTAGGTTIGIAKSNYLINGVPFTMIGVDGGTFMMGSTASSSSQPLHEVTLSSYSIGETEVTQSLWNTVMGENPSHFTGDLNRPVESVSWEDCQVFIGKLTQLTGQSFRLPTEAEWEFAARGGNKSQGYTYSGSNTLPEVAWFYINTDKPRPVGTKRANELGLYDMSGNVMEWCADMWYYYTNAAQTDPHGIGSYEERVIRNGAYSSQTSWCENGFRGWDTNTTRSTDVGLRLAFGDAAAMPLTLSQTEVSIIPGETRLVEILNGYGSYTVTGASHIVVADISDNVITVTGNHAGSTTLTIRDNTTNSIASLPITVVDTSCGDANFDGVRDENDYGELWYINNGKTPANTYTADVNHDGIITYDSNSYLLSSDNAALVVILYNDLMKTWRGYPFNDLSNPKYDTNCDGEINIADLNSIIDIIFGSITPSGDDGDLDNDGAVNWRDACIMHLVLMKLNGYFD